MNNFQKEYHNPIELIKKFWPDAPTNHITYDPKMRRGQYNVIRQAAHDGTLLFTMNILQETLVAIVNGQSFFKKTEPDNLGRVKYIQYIVGPMRHAIVFGKVKLNNRKLPGLRERIRMPVKCEYIY